MHPRLGRVAQLASSRRQQCAPPPPLCATQSQGCELITVARHRRILDQGSDASLSGRSFGALYLCLRYAVRRTIITVISVAMCTNFTRVNLVLRILQTVDGCLSWTLSTTVDGRPAGIIFYRHGPPGAVVNDLSSKLSKKGAVDAGVKLIHEREREKQTTFFIR